jgi:hypothetical protein
LCGSVGGAGGAACPNGAVNKAAAINAAVITSFMVLILFRRTASPRHGCATMRK